MTYEERIEAARRERAEAQQADFDAMFAPLPGSPLPLPLGDKIAVRYQAWRRTEQGRIVYDMIRSMALDEVAHGAKRIGVKELAERARGRAPGRIDNTLVSMIARELAESEHLLAPLIELRPRKAA